jgi:D-sedoheptulose 7-phosphate isomerase
MSTADYLSACRNALETLDHDTVDRMAEILRETAELGGRLFCLGSGGGAAHASHAAADFRKLCGLEAYCPSDNVAELTARINDEGWETTYVEWLRGSNLATDDVLLIISVGGGSLEPPVSPQLVRAIQHALSVGAAVLAIVGRDGGYAGQAAHQTVVIRCPVPGFVTPVTEGIQSIVLHALCSHERLQVRKAKWEGLQ